MKYLLPCLLTLSACASHAVTDAGAGRLSVTATSTHGVLAARELAGKLQRIEHLNITPELLTPLLAGVLEAGTKRLAGGPARP